MTVPYDIDQGGWGSSLTYPDSVEFTPRYLVVHWGGGTSQIPAGSEAERLRIWQSYHINSKGWSDIAYNYAVGDSSKIYRLRGLTPGGHVKCSVDVDPQGDSYCDSSIGVVWIGGQNDTDGPSQAALDSMGRIAATTGYEVKGHRTVKEENGSWTACPGPDWLQWITEEPWMNTNPDVIRIGGIDQRMEQISWWLYELEGGTVNHNGNSSQIVDLLGKTNVRQATIDDFNKIAVHLNLGTTARQKLIDNGLYFGGHETTGINRVWVENMIGESR